jgi:stearoyl-CoA desaturase (delta-9 desaturase)
VKKPDQTPTTTRSGGSAEHDRAAARPILWTNVAFFAVWTAATVVVVPWYVVRFGVSWTEIAACVGLWAITGLSITAGYHRLFAHKAYSASAPVRFLFAIFGAAAWEASIITWAAHHRFHHRFVDTDDDPYNARAGFWYSHIGWLLVEAAKHEDLSNVPDLWKDPICRWQHRFWIPIAVAVNLAVTVVLGVLTGNMLGMFVFALLLRVLIVHHTTWLINSAAHMWGSQRWTTQHTARDNWVLSLFTFGEGYHNYHHTFQADYRNGPIWHNWDPSKWLIWIMAKLGLAGNLRRVPVDVTLRRKFEQARRDLDLRVADFGDRAKATLGDQLEPIERHLEEAIKGLKAARESLQAAARDTAIPTRNLRRAVRSARRSAKRALCQWQHASRSYLASISPAAQLS